mmetsp:Transcript_1593/g.3469  ORF Transcript_1593/g.3469 Transcript_1593/m.3469 type:complete len:176 (-) Transcript_1593:226-753(-)
MSTADVEAKLSMSLDDLVKKKERGGSGGVKRRQATDKAGGKGGRHPAKTITKTKSSHGNANKGGGRPVQPGWRKHVECYEDEVTGDTVVRFYETDVVRITKEDIVLDSGGYSNEVTRQCINEALATYTFEVKVIQGKWFVSDGRFRLIRFSDGVVISGAAKELKQIETKAPRTYG